MEGWGYVSGLSSGVCCGVGKSEEVALVAASSG